ncbi:MAG TPA: TonB-dependent receptor [Phaeodactylibacter sp.]|nr:TonB-dependent receptor [Phaeodactylibacter sp.]
MLLLISLLPLLSRAQTKVTGLITDAESGEPLIGASVIVKDSGNGTVTDFDGNFELNIKTPLPVTLQISYIGFQPTEIALTADMAAKPLKVALAGDAVTIETVEILGQRISEKQKAGPLTVESMDALAIRETPAENFYDGLGNLKGVDITAASLGFKIINTRGFNSTSPVRSLQIIDGVDNQAPGLNFSLGNFLGSPELDVVRVDLIQGASSAFYGPNAFNGVISMETKNPFIHRGISVSLKTGERNLLEGALRFADQFTNKDGLPFMAFKLNFSYLQAYDWVADNYTPVYGTRTDENNPGGYDAVNIYGDEYSRYFDLRSVSPWSDFAGLGQWHRNGYREVDLVDYNTQNYKANLALHFRTAPDKAEESPELILSSSFGSGTTVYQGDNRFSLRDILFFQHRLEFRKKDKFFLRAYMTHDDAGKSFDPYFTALKLQEAAKDNVQWQIDYVNFWRLNVKPEMIELGYPELEFLLDEDGNIVYDDNGLPVLVFDNEAAQQWLTDYADSLAAWHAQAAAVANQGGNGYQAFIEPGTDRFEETFKDITSRKSNSEEGGTRFYDKSALYHLHGEYKFTPGFTDEWVVGANARLYTPISDGTIFYDTADIRITNFEYGAYTGIQKKVLDNRLIFNAAARLDKNQNFNYLFSPAASVVFKPRPNNYLRVSFSSAIRNPTLTDQYLYLNVGPAILSGNLHGVDSLIEVESFLDYLGSQVRDTLQYFSLEGVRPEKVKTIEAGYRTTLWNSLYLDMGYYFNFYRDFIGYRIGVDSDFDEFGFPTGTTVYRYSANSSNKVTTQGFSIGLNYYFADYFALNGNYSWNKLNKVFADDPIIPAFNTPKHKFNIGLSGRNMNIRFGGKTLRHVGFNINYKWVQGFLFEGSPQFTGFIPTYYLVDAQVNLHVKKLHTTFKVGASNLLNNLHYETYGGPNIGRLAYFTILYEYKKL